MNGWQGWKVMAMPDVIVTVPGWPDVSFPANDDLDCPFIGYVRVVPDAGYIDVPKEFVTKVPVARDA